MAIGGRPTAPQHRVGAHRWNALEQVPMKGAAPYAARRTPEVGVCKRASCATLSHGSTSGLTVSRDLICVPGRGFNITSLHLGTTVLRDWPRHLKGALEEARLTVRSYQHLFIAAAHEMRTPLFGHSMGGLVARGACHYGALARHEWLGRLDKLVFVGTPHHGAPLERAEPFLSANRPFSCPSGL